jgi:hypothetical protein
MTELTDAALVEQCRAGDKSAYGRLVMRHQLRVQRVLQAVLPYSEVDDVVQEAFLEAYLNLGKLRQPERFRAWLCGIGINLAKMRWRRMRWLVSLEMAVSLPSPQPLPERLVEQQETEQRLYDAISDLPPAEREALLLVYRDGFSQRETAEQLGISLSAVKVRVHRGRNRLRSALAIPMEVQMREIMIHDILAVKVDPNADLPDDDEVETMEKSELDALWRSLSEHHIVILKEKDADRYLPIWIGPSEAQLIMWKLQEKEVKRPLVFDLTRTLMDLGRLTLENVVVSRLHENVFYGSLNIRKNGTVHEVDCRPSDAINLAVRQNAPIFVADEVMEAAGTLPDEDGIYRFECSPSRPGLSWHSLLREETSQAGK